MKFAFLVLLALILPVAGQQYVLDVTSDLENRVSLGERIVTVQILDDAGKLVDVDSMICELTNPNNMKEDINFRRKSLGTYEGTLNFNTPNIYYLTFMPIKQGFAFEGQERIVYVDKPGGIFVWDTYVLPAAIAIIIFGGGYLVFSKK